MTNVEKFKQLWKVFLDEEEKRNGSSFDVFAGLKHDTPEYAAASALRRAKEDTGRRLYDGEYDLTGLEYLVVEGEEGNLRNEKEDKGEIAAGEALAFVEKHPDFTIGHGYQAYSMVLVSGRPPRYDGKVYGSYEYGGATCVFEKPAVLLLIAEDV